ncbi:MAG: thioredoxin family protein [Bacilli bacterium]
MKKIYLIVSVLAIITLGLGGYIIYDKFISEDKIEEKEDKKIKNENNSSSHDDKNNSGIINNIIENINHSATLKTIELNDLQKLIAEEKDFIILYSQTTCGHCTLFKPVLEEIVNEYKIEILVLEVNLLNENEFDDFLDISDINATPVLAFFADGKEEVSQRLSGEKTKEVVVERLKDLGYIN